MQLELDFTAKELEQTSKEFFANCYSILVWMHILTA